MFLRNDKFYNIGFVYFLMDELSSLKKKVVAQDRRIKRIENVLDSEGFFDDEVHEEKSSDVVPTPSVKKVKSGPSISFNQVITVLGILGISIGAVSFFFYGIARGWFGEAVQVGIGVLFGLILFFVAYFLREKNQIWSNVVFGGAYFIEYLSIGIGVSVYRIMPASMGIIFGFLLLISSIVLATKFSSRMIAYFSLVGGFLIPIITDSFEAQIFVMIWYLFILIALSSVSISFNWGDLRAVMLGLMTIFMWVSFGQGKEELEFLFLGLYFVLFNVSSLVNSVLNDNKMNSADSLVLGFLPLVVLPLISRISDSSNTKMFGLIVILFSFIYLLEAAYLKSKNMNFHNVLYSLIAAGVATLNIGIYFLLSEFINLEFFIIFFIIEWALFSYLSQGAKDGFHKVVSFFFLFLIAVWYAFVLQFRDGGYHASFFMLVLVSVPIISFFYFRSNINFKVSAATFIISGFLVLFSFSKALWYVFGSDSVCEVILSVMWLIYTLVLFVQTQTKEGKMLVGFLLGITLLKIAFRDLFFLSGGFRIVGFILFGVLLLIGGYFLGNENKK